MPSLQRRRTGQSTTGKAQGKTGYWTPGASTTGMTGVENPASRGRVRQRAGNAGTIQHLSSPRGAEGDPKELRKMTGFLQNYVGFLSDLGLINGDPDVAYNIGVRLASTGTI